jgi:hypothetical protein
VVPEDRGCGLPGGQSVQEQSPGESPSSTPVPAGYREEVREISKLVADDEREDPRGDSLGAQASPERGYVEADVAEAAELPPVRLAQDRLTVAYPCRAARQAAAGRTRRHYDRFSAAPNAACRSNSLPTSSWLPRGPADAIDQKPPSRAAG